MNQQQLRRHAQAAAQRLADDLAEGEKAARGWTDALATARIVDAAMNRCLAQLEATGCQGEANRGPSSELWRIAGAWLQTGSLQARARWKPRGYAGDFEMLAQICDRVCCSHPLGRAFDRFFQDQAAPEAVRNRTRWIADSLVAERRRRPGPFRALSLGAGPAIDVQQALVQLSGQELADLHVTLLEIDPAALDYARSRLTPLLPDGRLQLLRENLLRLPRRAAAVARGLADQHFLFCAGLFDYLPPDDAIAMLQFLWRLLTPGGAMIVFNFSPHNPSRSYMEWIGNWYLIHREEDQLTQLARDAGLPDHCLTVESEPLGVNLALCARKEDER